MQDNLEQPSIWNSNDTVKFLEEQMKVIEQMQGGEEDQDMRQSLNNLKNKLGALEQKSESVQEPQIQSQDDQVDSINETNLLDEQKNLFQHLNKIDDMMKGIQYDIDQLDPETKDLLSRSTQLLVNQSNNDQNQQEQYQKQINSGQFTFQQ